MFTAQQEANTEEGGWHRPVVSGSCRTTPLLYVEIGLGLGVVAMCWKAVPVPPSAPFTATSRSTSAALVSLKTGRGTGD